MLWHDNKDAFVEYCKIDVSLASVTKEQDIYDIWKAIYIESKLIPPHIARGLRQRLEQVSLGTFNKSVGEIIVEVG